MLTQQPLFHICFYCSSEISQANHPPGQVDRMAKRRPQLAHGEFVSFSLKRNLTKTRQSGRRCAKANISPNLFPWILKCLWGLNCWNRKGKPFFQPKDSFLFKLLDPKMLILNLSCDQDSSFFFFSSSCRWVSAAFSFSRKIDVDKSLMAPEHNT